MISTRGTSGFDHDQPAPALVVQCGVLPDPGVPDSHGDGFLLDRGVDVDPFAGGGVLDRIGRSLVGGEGHRASYPIRQIRRCEPPCEFMAKSS